MTEGDPMIYGSDSEREAYTQKIADAMKQAIEEDRAERRKPGKSDSQQTSLIGGTGVPGSLIQSTL